jgi:stearoyl-CoA desaturase (delta-9 desaturase)
MHRRHHLYSDTPRDPHSPLFQGVLPLLYGQLKSYEETLVGLIKNKKEFTSFVTDLDFPVSFLNRKGFWYLPYVLQAALALAIGWGSGYWLWGFAYWLGIMSHPIQGWMVNALAHRFGYRNFPTADNSRNNYFVALLVWGEGYQNNHHHAPQSALFGVKWWELDLGFYLCRLGKWLGLLEMRPIP